MCPLWEATQQVARIDFVREPMTQARRERGGELTSRQSGKAELDRRWFVVVPRGTDAYQERVLCARQASCYVGRCDVGVRLGFSRGAKRWGRWKASDRQSPAREARRGDGASERSLGLASSAQQEALVFGIWYLVSGVLHRPNRLSDVQRV